MKGILRLSLQAHEQGCNNRPSLKTSTYRPFLFIRSEGLWPDDHLALRQTPPPQAFLVGEAKETERYSLSIVTDCKDKMYTDRCGDTTKKRKRDRD